MKIKKLRAFSLIELLIVIMIIGILATVSIVSYNGTQKVARDNQRKSDLAAISTAYKMYYADKKSWIDSSGLDSTWFNKPGAGGKSMAKALTQDGYLSKSPLDPLLKLETDGVALNTTTQHQYLKYSCRNAAGVSLGGVVLLAQLERAPAASEIDVSATECMSGASSVLSKLKTSYGVNYAVRVK